MTRGKIKKKSFYQRFKNCETFSDQSDIFEFKDVYWYFYSDYSHHNLI